MKNLLSNLLVFLYIPLFLLSFSSYAEDKNWKSPLYVEGTTTITTEEAKKYHDDGMIFLDVRSLRYFNKRHIPGAKHLSLKDDFTEENLLKIGSKQTPMVFYCNGPHCSLSYRASTKAVGWGFEKIYYYREGFRTWREAGHKYEVVDPANKTDAR